MILLDVFVRARVLALSSHHGQTRRIRHISQQKMLVQEAPRVFVDQIIMPARASGQSPYNFLPPLFLPFRLQFRELVVGIYAAARRRASTYKIAADSTSDVARRWFINNARTCRLRRSLRSTIKNYYYYCKKENHIRIYI